MHDTQTHPILRAVRLFLDVIYFHPFCDGNGRASHLWLHYCLARERVPFPQEPQFLLTQSKDPKKVNYWDLALTVAGYILSQLQK